MLQKIPIFAIICEFDPLHFGHRLILEKARALGGAVCCIMSGNFVQRGAPAMADKWDRARMALSCGADLVAELPLSWACAGAERFAAGGVALAGALGARGLLFGSETPDAALLDRLARALLSPEFSRLLQADSGKKNFAVRRQRAAARLLGEDAARVLSLPNANLGVEYRKAILRQGLDLAPIPILRQGAGHSGGSFDGNAPKFLPTGQPRARSQEAPGAGPLPAGTRSQAPGPAPYYSAGELREILFQGGSLEALIPGQAWEILERSLKAGRCPAEPRRLELPILSRLRSLPREAFSRLPDLSEGMENRLYRAARQAGSLSELYALAKSRRTSHARVRRLVMAAFLGLQAPLPELPPYLRVIAVTERGRQVLRQLDSKLPLAVRPKDLEKLDPAVREVFAQEVLADDLYALCCPRPQPCGRDYTEKLILLP
ncbi:HIGH nucleotidyl transferase [Acutalibacter sp. 1XD8-33]|uniref:nucleotidyltransferase family protein n=1 Tax=Acutalibacter sp. 1XD8-33 TaxID=2320081 RepID=UPI000EA2F89E|nr:nucleotidyltransferase family protein [Acutalibacter sp. 1XD8-33]RKJ41334.1 HIGH nucleotidyl transferase [Acutalibacter sp. 1XD8-33]